jgi:UDP-2,4-diacetamido-2,4,6-trideoxy-beta-L-altropyranose hydrolase
LSHAVYIRADANAEIGLGHLTRCIALAQMLKGSFQVGFFCKAIPGELAAQLLQNDFELHKIETEPEFFSVLTASDIVVIDGYEFNTVYQEQIKQKGSKLVCIDDMKDQEFVADLIINHSPGARRENYKAKEYTRFALGLEYALLRPVFLSTVDEPHVINGIDSVLICFGGADYKNFTEQVLRIVLSFQEFKKIAVVTGFAYQFTDKLIELIQSESRVAYYHAIDADQMHSLMRTNDMAIVPASSVMVEALSQKMVVLSGYYIENQKIAYQAMREARLVYGIGDFDGFSRQAFENSLQEIKKDIKKKERVYANIGSGKMIDAFKSLTIA